MNILKKYECYENANMKRYNTYKLDTTCKYLVYVKNVEELVNLVKYLKENNIKYLVLGNGSNVILSKEFYDGVIIKLDKLNNVTINDNIVTVEAGYSLMKLAKDVLKYNLTGLEFAAGIPGLVGASVAMNAGAYNKDMASVVKEINVIDENGNIKILTNSELKFAYRDSLLKHNKNYICISATLELEKGDVSESLKIIEERRQRRLQTQPLEFPSAGSVFRNPENIPAGKLIEDCGLKGYNVNGAEVSTKHANFIVNKSNCKGEDIIKLIDIIRKKVYDEYKIDLVLEQEIIR